MTRYAWADVLALAFFAVLFLPYPLYGSLASNCDVYLGMALADGYALRIEGLLDGAPVGVAMWPDGFMRQGEATPLFGLGLAAARLAGASWPWTLYGALVFVFATNVMAMRRCVGALCGDAAVGVVVGFGFSVANIMWANIDDLVVVWWAIPALVTWLVARAEIDDRRWVWWVAVLTGLQLYASVYVYAFQNIWLIALFAARFIAARRMPGRDDWGYVVRGAALHIAVIAGLVAIYAGNRSGVSPKPLETDWAVVHQVTALTPWHWFANLPDTVLHPGLEVGELVWSETRKRVGFGWMWAALGAAVFFVRRAPRPALALVFAFGLGFSLADFIGWGPISTPLVTLVPPLRYLRVVSRAHLLILFAASIGVGFVLTALRTRLDPRLSGFVFATVLLVHVLENVPAPLPAHESLPLQVPSALTEALREDEEAVVLHLPADDPFSMEGGQRMLFPYNREVLYVIWQRQHRRNTVSGASGFFPIHRLNVAAQAMSFPADEALVALGRAGVTHIALHPELALTDRERTLAELRDLPGLSVVVDEPNLRVWRLEAR